MTGCGKKGLFNFILFTVYLTVLIAKHMNVLYITKPFKKYTLDVFHTPPDVLCGIISRIVYAIHV